MATPTRMSKGVDLGEERGGYKPIFKAKKMIED